MSSDEDDYLSAKFLSDGPSETKPAPKTYSQIRKEAKKRSQMKQEQNRLKSRRVRELESREEGLSKSLFERAKEDEDAGLGNKALSMMMKMGFKPGQSLGTEEAQRKAEDDTADTGENRSPPSVSLPHRKEPLPLREWTGKQGVGLGKRARSPDASERMAKMAKIAEQADQRDFRERAREEYNNRRAEGRLGPAQRTCATLDEQMGKEFNVLWLNPNNENSFPPGLIEALTLHSNLVVPGVGQYQGNSSGASAEGERLKLQMKADALVPVGTEDEEESKAAVSGVDQWSGENLEEASQFLRLQAQDRLHLVLLYLRSRHQYCFWCGIKYDDEEELENQCPGPEEDDHD